MDEQEKQPEDSDERRLTVLPAREAMSILAPDTAPYEADLGEERASPEESSHPRKPA